jgi:hypothetical protein
MCSRKGGRPTEAVDWKMARLATRNPTSVVSDAISFGLTPKRRALRWSRCAL